MYSKWIINKALKKYVIFEGGGSHQITEDYKGGGGGSQNPKNGLRNFLMFPFQWSAVVLLDKIIISYIVLS